MSKVLAVSRKTLKELLRQRRTLLMSLLLHAGLGHHQRIRLGEVEAPARPVLQPLDRLEVDEALGRGGEGRGACVGVGPEPHRRYIQGMREAWMTSGTPWPPTDLIARSTSFNAKRCVVTFSSGKRFEASWASASSHAL